MPQHGTQLLSSRKRTNGRFYHIVPAAVLALVAGLPLLAAPVTAGCIDGDGAAVHSAVSTPLSVTPEIREWAERTVPSRGSEIARLRLLHRALLREFPQGYADAGGERFATRFVALARELGIQAYFVAVDRSVTTESGVRYHGTPDLAAGFGLDGRVVVFDAVAVSRPAHQFLQILTDRQAAAVLHWNAGIDLLRNGKHDEAIERLETTVLLAPDLASAWSTLGGALRQTGQNDEALDAYERSIALALAR